MYKNNKSSLFTIWTTNVYFMNKFQKVCDRCVTVSINYFHCKYISLSFFCSVHHKFHSAEKFSYFLMSFCNYIMFLKELFSTFKRLSRGII